MPGGFNASVNHRNLHFLLSKLFLLKQLLITSNHSYKSSNMACVLGMLIFRQNFPLHLNVIQKIPMCAMITLIK